MTPDSLIVNFRESPNTTPESSLPTLPELRGRLAGRSNVIAILRDTITQANGIFDARYKANLSINDIVRDRALLVDHILRIVWERQDWPDERNISLVAVGGYGRSELLPHSDIDLMILTRRDRHGDYKPAISSFLTTLWDIGLEIGQSVRSVKQCKAEAKNDITVLTALMESRTIIGPGDLHRDMIKGINARNVWPIKKFLRAKWDEQLQRHEKYHDIDYALEPNVKTSPGGLRDIQTIAWVAMRHFGARSFADLVQLGFLKPSEEAMINKGRQFLWKLRYGLHMLEGRREDRLLFDKQRELAKLFGYEDDGNSLGVEKLMKQYYRAVANLRELNDVLLQHFDEAILRSGEREKIKPINSRFQVRNGYIEATSPGIFQRFPFALLEVFVLMAQDSEIKGVRASTIRLLRDNRRLIDDRFRHDIRAITLFMELLRSPCLLATQLRRMNRYGILGRYLPEFEQITGQMQHDLFHIYTVDAHTLQVVENMRRFLYPEAEKNFPLAAHIARNLPKIELLYIAGIYHDIAKGRGGDHSTLGRTDVENFCRRHRLSDWDRRLVGWLVEKHLFMSMTAQRKDIDDPEVVHEFATLVGDKLHLDYLYALTVADIRATNPDLWNSWRASLLRKLYLSTKRMLRQGLENPMDREERIADKKDTAFNRLRERGLGPKQIESVWANADDEYFLRESAHNVVWHTEAIARHDGGRPLISIDEAAGTTNEGATQIFIYMRNSDYLFARTTAAFEKLKLNIFSARIFTSINNYCMDTYTVLEENGRPVGNNNRRLNEIKTVLAGYLTTTGPNIRQVAYRRSRKERYFGRHVDAMLINTPGKNYSTLEINCPDHPGILATLGKTFAKLDVDIRDARITTLGERVEDLFFITDKNGHTLTDPDRIDKVQQAVKDALEDRLIHNKPAETG